LRTLFRRELFALLVLSLAVGCRRDEAVRGGSSGSAASSGSAVGSVRVFTKDDLVGATRADVRRLVHGIPKRLEGEWMLGVPVPPTPIRSMERSKWPSGFGFVPDGAREQWIYRTTSSRRTRSVFFNEQGRVIRVVDEFGDF